MMNLIDADERRKKINYDYELVLTEYSDDDTAKEVAKNLRDVCLSYINNAPVICQELISDLKECAPVVHAHWKIEAENGGYKHTICSNCGAEQAITFAECGNKYCDACGARMDEVV